ncbi:hypothetical protein EIY71_15305 [Pseudomonas sp. CH235]|nr:hypothetical protein EIY71_15305 [Pseudomonas sp. CH235]
MIVPTSRRRTVCVGMPLVTLCVTVRDAERPWLHSHAERGNDQRGDRPYSVGIKKTPLISRWAAFFIALQR